MVDDVPANTRLLEARLSADYYQTKAAADGYTWLYSSSTTAENMKLLKNPGYDVKEAIKNLAQWILSN